MTSRTKKRRPHAALVGRIIVTGVSTSATLALVGGMAISDDLAEASSSDSTASQPPFPGLGAAGSGEAGGAAPAAVETTRPTIVVVRRIHVTENGVSSSPDVGPSGVISSAIPTPAPTPSYTPAPVYTPAPAPAPVHSSSGGS